MLNELLARYWMSNVWFGLHRNKKFKSRPVGNVVSALVSKITVSYMNKRAGPYGLIIKWELAHICVDNSSFFAILIASEKRKQTEFSSRSLFIFEFLNSNEFQANLFYGYNMHSIPKFKMRVVSRLFVMLMILIVRFQYLFALLPRLCHTRNETDMDNFYFSYKALFMEIAGMMH